ncbi:hypothetical protein [Rhizobium sp. SGZ-381]|uniref:hypothetical protein n=1 Tax=Rhizobium sp. SGZ-381 TaxID=3342800 RepID=UPI0036713DEE
MITSRLGSMRLRAAMLRSEELANAKSGLEELFFVSPYTRARHLKKPEMGRSSRIRQALFMAAGAIRQGTPVQSALAA